MYTTRTIDSFQNLFLPDGRRAVSLRWAQLMPELQRLRIPDIDAQDGKDVLLKKYAAHVAAVAETLPKSGMPVRTLSETVAKQIAKVIAQQAATPMVGPTVVSPPHVGM